MRVRASIQLAADAPDASVGHLASGAVVRPDVVVVPNVDASVLRHDGPYVAVIVTQMQGAPAPWELPDEPPFVGGEIPDDLPGEVLEDAASAEGEGFQGGMFVLGIATVHWIRCVPEEVHILDPARLQAGFRLVAPFPEPLGQVNINTLLETAQEEVWPEARAVLGAIPTALTEGVPLLGSTTKVAWHVVTPVRSSWCRFVPWC